MYIRSGLKTDQDSYLGQMNINSIRNMFDLLMNIIKYEIDVFMISETKIDNNFPVSQFTITDYSIPFKPDSTSHGGGIILFVMEDIPYKIIKTVLLIWKGFS